MLLFSPKMLKFALGRKPKMVSAPKQPKHIWFFSENGVFHPTWRIRVNICSFCTSRPNFFSRIRLENQQKQFRYNAFKSRKSTWYLPPNSFTFSLPFVEDVSFIRVLVGLLVVVGVVAIHISSIHDSLQKVRMSHLYL